MGTYSASDQKATPTRHEVRLPRADATPRSFLATRRGKLTLALLAAIAFLDFVDASIVNVALPSIRRDLGFSVQSLVWVPGGYLLTYGGFMLLGGRLADLYGRTGGQPFFDNQTRTYAAAAPGLLPDALVAVAKA